MKQTICALALGAATLLGCETPIETRPDGTHEITIPAECDEYLHMSQGYGGWDLSCKGSEGQDLYFARASTNSNWIRYEVVRE